MHRRSFLATGASTGAMLLFASIAGAKTALAAAEGVDVEAILNDPEAPVGGNPNGDVTIVAFLDYNCPFCRRSEPDLQRVVSTDGRIRLVYKDWPILARSSVTGARLALGAKYQEKYKSAHAALMAIRGKKTSDAAMREAVLSSGVDGAQLDKDLDAHDAAIGGLLRRNSAQANALGLKGTPVYLVGPYVVAAALDYDGFADVVSKFRSQIGK